MTDLSRLKRARHSLAEGYSKPPANDLERDGAIQRFEFTFELFWKTGKKVLAETGRTSTSPKDTLRLLAQDRWIEDIEPFFVYLLARNTSSHICEEETAKWVYSQGQSFLRELDSFILRVEEEQKS